MYRTRSDDLSDADFAALCRLIRKCLVIYVDLERILASSRYC